MPKWSQSRRLLKLMQQLQWLGRDDWEAVNNRRDAETYLPEFVEWLQDKVSFLPDSIKDTFIGYYFDNATGNVGEGYYYRLEQGRSALQVLYAAQQEDRGTESLKELYDWSMVNSELGSAALYGFSLSLANDTFFPLALEIAQNTEFPVIVRHRTVGEAFKRNIPDGLRDTFLELLEDLSQKVRKNDRNYA